MPRTSARKLCGNSVSGNVQRLRCCGRQRQRHDLQVRMVGGQLIPDPDDTACVADRIRHFTGPPQRLDKASHMRVVDLRDGATLLSR